MLHVSELNKFYREYKNVANFATILLHEIENTAKLQNTTNFTAANLKMPQISKCRECDVLFKCPTISFCFPTCFVS